MSIQNAMSRIGREAGIKRCIIVEGNVGDVYLSGRRILGLEDYLVKLLKDAGFVDVIAWDRVTGMRGEVEQAVLTDEEPDPSDGDAYDLGGIDLGPADRTGAATDPADMMAVVRRTLADSDRRVAFILDWSEYLFSTGGMLDAADRQNLTVLGKSIRDARPSYTSEGRQSCVVIVAGKASMLPLSLYSGNPEASVVTVGKPDIAERRAMVERIASGFSLRGEADIRESERLPDYVDMLSEFTNREIIQMANMSRTEEKTTFEKLFYLFRYGEKDNPWEKLDHAKLKGMKKFLSERVIGQERAVDRVYDTIVKAFTGVTGMHKSSSRSMPKGVFFFVGPTGVGKTELSKAIAKFLFGDESACIRFDMSEYAQPNSDQKLIGAPPGYVGYEEGGQLTNAIRERPFSVVLFDEIEKAAKPNPRILDIFLQILEDGRLTDSRGETAYFSDAIIIFTSNLGASEVSDSGDQEAVAKEFTRIVREYFDRELKRPEILGRIGYRNIVPFNFIDDPEFAVDILRSKMKPIRAAMQDKYRMELEIDNEHEFYNYVLGEADLSKGGRDILNALDNMLLTPLSKFLFDNYDDLRSFRGSVLHVAVKDGELGFYFDDRALQRGRDQDGYPRRGPRAPDGGVVPGLRHPLPWVLQPRAPAPGAQEAHDHRGPPRRRVRGEGPGRRGGHPPRGRAHAAGRAARPVLRPQEDGPRRDPLHGEALRGPGPGARGVGGPGRRRRVPRGPARRGAQPRGLPQPAHRRRVWALRGVYGLVHRAQAPEGRGVRRRGRAPHQRRRAPATPGTAPVKPI